MTPPNESVRTRQPFLSAVAAADSIADRLRILLVVSSPIDEPVRVNGSQEVGDLHQELMWARVPAGLIRLNPPTFRFLQTALLTRRFDIVHFIGHAKPQALQLEHEDASADWIPSEELASLFIESRVKLVVLNNCSSESIGDSVVLNTVPAVVACSRPLQSDVALLLAGPLYSALAAGRSLKDALEAVKRRIHREHDGKEARIFTISGPDVDRAIVAAPLQAGDADYFSCEPPNNLPQSFRDHFFDRITEHVAVYKLLRDGQSPFTGIYGIPGSGKSTVAISAASRYSWRFPRGVAYASLRSMRPFNTASLFTHLEWGLDDAPTHRQHTIALYELAKGGVLLVIDDLEVATNEELTSILNLLRSWNTTLGGRAILVMRSRRAEFDEVVGNNWIQIGDMPPDAALELFTDKLGGAWAAKTALGASVATVPRLCYFHPKLLALTAAALSIGVSWDELRRQIEEFTGGPVGQIVNILDFSIRQAEKDAPVAGQLLDCWSAFANGATEDAWRFVVLGKKNSTADPMFQLQSDAFAILQRAGILERFTLDGRQHCSIHPLVSEYVNKHRWAQLSDEKRLTYRNRHVQFYTSAFHDNPSGYPITEDWDNISLAIKAAEKWHQWQPLMALCLELVGKGGALLKRGYWHHSKQALQPGIRAALELKDTKDHSVFLYNLGICHYRLAEYQEAHTALLQASQDLKELAEPELALDIARELGRLHYRLGDYDLAREQFAHLLSESEQLHDKARQADALHELGRLAYRQGDHRRSEESLARALSLREEIHDELNVAHTLHETGRLLHAIGRFDEAESAYTRSLVITRALGDRLGQQATIHQLGLLEVDRGNLAAARARYIECAELSNALNDRFWIAHNLFRSADLNWREGRRTEAIAEATKARDLCGLLGITLEAEVQAWLKSHVS